MNIRLLMCCLSGAAAAGVFSEHQFTTEYATYVDQKDAAAVRTTNANIVNTAPPAVSLAKEHEMHRWYHDVDAAVQADAKAIMGKALVKAEAASGAHPTANCLTDILAAMPAGAFKKMYEDYNKILGDSTLKDDGTEDKQIKARACVKALSGAEKELAIQAGLRAPLFKKFQDALTLGLPKTPPDMLLASELVTGTLAATADAKVEKGKDTQPMYSMADAALRREMMSEMVTQLNHNLPTAL